MTTKKGALEPLQPPKNRDGITHKGTLVPPRPLIQGEKTSPPQRDQTGDTPTGQQATARGTPAPAGISPDWPKYIAFTNKAGIRPFHSYPSPAKCTPEEVNDDLKTGSYEQSKYVWAGEQRKGLLSTITDAQGRADHVERAATQEFLLTKDIPLPPELTEALDFIQSAPPEAIRSFWMKQRARIRALVEDSKVDQLLWDADIHPDIAPATGKLKTLALHALLSHFDLGGAKWLQQFNFGFPIVGAVSQEGVYKPDPTIGDPPAISGIWAGAQERFTTRAKASGRLHATELWNEALEQTRAGWLDGPQPLLEDGSLLLPTPHQPIIAFRFGVDQSDKLRACDDLKYSKTNEFCSVKTPISLPTWDHIGQMATTVADSARPWSFLKTDHAAAYKQLPLRPDQANLAVIALRDPTTDQWAAFRSRTLVFGSTAAVLHYNCLSRCIAALVSKTFGIPMIGYFDDYGAFVPSDLEGDAEETIDDFMSALVIIMKDDKRQRGSSLTFLGLLGEFPSPQTDMQLRISLPPVKTSAWCDMLERLINLGVATEQELQSVVGRLSFTQTCIYGKMGRAMLSPFYEKLKTPYYHPRLEERELNALRWWVVALKALKPRVVRPYQKYPDILIYTDAATSTQIICALVISVDQFKTSHTISECATMTTGKRWKTLFNKTNYIYGLEMLALLALVIDPRADIDGKAIVFYLDNDNAVKAMVKNKSDTRVIQTMTLLIWHILAIRGVRAWFEWVGSNFNPADLPTRKAPLPFPVRKNYQFRNLNRAHELIKEGLICVENGRPIPIPTGIPGFSV